MNIIDSICDQVLNVDLNNYDEYNELVYYLNFQDTCFENIMLVLLNSDKRYRRYLHNISIWNVDGNNNNDIPKDINIYLGINLTRESLKIKLELMRSIDSRIFNILQNLKN